MKQVSLNMKHASLNSSKQVAFERYDRSQSIKLSSDRAFGLVFTVFFLIASVLSYKTYIVYLNPWIYTACSLLVISLFKPKLLAPFNRIWFLFGLLLHRIMNPLIMGMLFFGIMTPMGFIARLWGWDPLRLKKCDSTVSYWIYRKQNEMSSLKNQF